MAGGVRVGSAASCASENDAPSGVGLHRELSGGLSFQVVSLLYTGTAVRFLACRFVGI